MNHHLSIHFILLFWNFDKLNHSNMLQFEETRTINGFQIQKLRNYYASKIAGVERYKSRKRCSNNNCQPISLKLYSDFGFYVLYANIRGLLVGILTVLGCEIIACTTIHQIRLSNNASFHWLSLSSYLAFNFHFKSLDCSTVEQHALSLIYLDSNNWLIISDLILW